MKPLFTFMLSLLLESVNAEIFNPEEITENDLTEASNLSSKDEENQNGDPFVSNLAGGEERDNQEASSNLIENTNTDENTASNLAQASEDAVETVIALNQDDTENKESSNTEKKESSNTEKEPLTEDSQTPEPKVLLSSNSGSKEKIGVPYWTKVVLNKKTQDVLVNVKTVTIIESLGASTASAGKAPESISKTTEVGKASSSSVSKPAVSSKNTSTSKIASSSASATPYIKIQMPSNKSSSASKISSTNKSSTKNSSTNKPSAKKSSTNKSSTKKSSTTSNSKTSSSKSSSASQTKPVSSSVKKSTSAVSKNDAFTKHASETRSSSQYKTASADSSSSIAVGSIFDVLRNLPSGGNGSENVFIEGSFKFPKERELRKKVFKLSGYIASN